MKPTILALAGLGATLALAACGSAAATTTGAKSSTSPRSSGSGDAVRRGGGAAGELVRIGTTWLVLDTRSGDVTVDYTSGTPVSKTRTGTVADITNGTCITATGQKNADGSVSVSQVLLNALVNGSCDGSFLFGGRGLGGGAPQPGGSPRPSFSPRPGAPAIGVVRGQVTGVSGTSVTVLPRTGTSSTITVPTTVHVTVVDSASTSDLSVGDCVLATGQKNSAGVVTARSLTIAPAGANGCFSGGGGFGRFGGGGAGAGGGGGGGFGGSGGGGEGGAAPGGA